MSVSVTNLVRISTWFMPTPVARTTPSARSFSSAGYASRSACSPWSSGSWMSAMSTRSRPSLPKLASRLRRTPSALKSNRLTWAAGTSDPLGVRGRPGPAGIGDPGGAGGLEEAADLGGDHVLVPRTVPQCVAETALGRAEAVVRRGVERADAAVPRRVDRGPGVVIAHRGEQVPDRRTAEGQLRDADRRAAEPA
jgi:hypothetical protein